METTEIKDKMDLSVILPIKSASAKRFDELFHSSILSLQTQVVSFEELIIVHTDETQLVEFLDGYDFSGIQRENHKGFRTSRKH